jgi:membrane fusion protein, multidrug efflux system
MKDFSQKFIAILLFFNFLSPALNAGEVSDAWDKDVNNIRGLVKPVTSATLSSEIHGRIINMPYGMGDAFVKGKSLIQFDCSLHDAELAAARAELDAVRKKHENNLQLLELNAISNIEVDISETEVKKAAAEKQIANVRVRRCTIKAPYNGRVVETMVHEHESVGPNQKIISILSDEQLEIELIVPSGWLTWLKKDVEFQFLVDETNTNYKAKVAQLGASVDPVSQTIRVKGVFQSDSSEVLSGMSGTAKFKTQD